MARVAAGMTRSKKARRPKGRAVLIVLPLTPERVLRRVAKRFVDDAPDDRCAKCGSTFVGREPAFIHCFYCGKMARIANASLVDQELFEIRSGLRLAS